MTVIYESTGIVIGNCWGGGKCGFAAEPLTASTKESLLKKANTMLKDGSLDSGMGYESLTGAILRITRKEHRFIDGKDFVNEKDEVVEIGNVTTQERNTLIYDV